VTAPDPDLPEVPHEGAPYQGYGPRPYQPPAPVPPPVPPGFGVPTQAPVPVDQPPPPVERPLNEPRRTSSAPAIATGDGEVLQKWGYVMAISTVIMPILALVGLILGAITATKPGRERHGAWIMGISVALGAITVLLWATVYEGN
jgi:hypothetical protein